MTLTKMEGDTCKGVDRIERTRAAAKAEAKAGAKAKAGPGAKVSKA